MGDDTLKTVWVMDDFGTIEATLPLPEQIHSITADEHRPAAWITGGKGTLFHVSSGPIEILKTIRVGRGLIARDVAADKRSVWVVVARKPRE